MTGFIVNTVFWWWVPVKKKKKKCCTNHLLFISTSFEAFPCGKSVGCTLRFLCFFLFLPYCHSLSFPFLKSCPSLMSGTFDFPVFLQTCHFWHRADSKPVSALHTKLTVWNEAWYQVARTVKEPTSVHVEQHLHFPGLHKSSDAL